MTTPDMTEYREWLEEHKDDPEIIALGIRLGMLLAPEK